MMCICTYCGMCRAIYITILFLIQLRHGVKFQIFIILLSTYLAIAYAYGSSTHLFYTTFSTGLIRSILDATDIYLSFDLSARKQQPRVTCSIRSQPQLLPPKAEPDISKFETARRTKTMIKEKVREAKSLLYKSASDYTKHNTTSSSREESL